MTCMTATVQITSTTTFTEVLSPQKSKKMHVQWAPKTHDERPTVRGKAFTLTPGDKVLACACGVLVFALTTAFQLLRVPAMIYSALRKVLLPEPQHEEARVAGCGWAMGWLYDALDFWWEYEHYTRLRPMICGDVEGEVLECGVGTGRNLPYYSSSASVRGVDLCKDQIDLAMLRAQEEELACTVQSLTVADASKLTNIPDSSVDVVISTFMFCVLPEEIIPAVLSEVHRVLRPGGTFRFADIQYSRSSMLQYLVQRWYAPYVHFAYGARFDGKIRKYLEKHEGLVLTRQIPLKGDTLWLLEGKRAK